MKKFLIIIFSFIPSLVFSAEKGLDKKIDEAFAPVSDFFSQLVFFEILGYPFVILLLVSSAVFFTIFFGFPNFKYFLTAINVVRGKFERVLRQTL